MYLKILGHQSLVLRLRLLPRVSWVLHFRKLERNPEGNTLNTQVILPVRIPAPNRVLLILVGNCESPVVIPKGKATRSAQRNIDAVSVLALGNPVVH